MAIRSLLERFAPKPDRAPARVIAVLGMHRSGTSAITRGLQALGVYLGDDFLDAQPENPTGYWEDRGVVDLNERVLRALGLTWDDSARIDPARFAIPALGKLRKAASRYVARTFAGRPLWGFKDPRTLRVLPLWLDVFAKSGAADAYLLVIRNPMSVAKSLFTRQRMALDDALRLWLAYSVPFFSRIAGKPLIVVDYDCFMREPRRELERVAYGLRLTLPSERAGDLDRFENEFLDERLRHTVFSIDEIETATAAGRSTRDAYRLLFELASDRRPADEQFWSAWQSVAQGYTSNVVGGGEGSRHD